MKRLQSILAAFSRMVIAGIFWLAVRLLYDVEVHGLEYDTRGPHTYFAMAHKRDLDPIVEIPTILAHRGWRALTKDVHFAMRGDAFSPGFLARIVLEPRWFSRFLRLISVRPVLHVLGIHPFENLNFRPAEMWIRELLRIEGDVRAADVLTPAFLQEVAGVAGEDHHQLENYQLSELLAWRYQQALQSFCGAEIFKEPARRHAKRYALTKFKQELADLAGWLSSGGSLWGAPEGQLSPAGSLGPITAGLHRLLRAAPPDTRIVPIFITYDSMTVRRKRIFIDLTPTIEQAPLQPSRELDAQLRCAWLQSARFTCTQIASGFLVQASRAATPAFTLDELVKEVGLRATHLTETGRHVDQRLLHPRSTRKLAAGFLKYAARHGLVRRTGEHTWVPTAGDLVIEVRPGDVGYRHAPLAYAWNELQDMLSIM